MILTLPKTAPSTMIRGLKAIHAKATFHPFQSAIEYAPHQVAHQVINTDTSFPIAVETACILLKNGKYTVKPTLSSHSKIDKTKVLRTNGSLMKVESIAECSL